MNKKVVLIAGTNSGFGWLTANCVAALGHKVYATMRDTDGKNAEKAKALSQVQNITVLDVTLTWRMMKLVLPFMRKQSEGLIINITSGFGRFSFPFSAVYGSSKFALEGLSEGLHYEVRPLGVDVSIILRSVP